eukprot:CAMPEP_0119122280 /NCGR_PEP_ID=MMETSP1310-20130426/2584_1 /TAXON_ID=464262 /ORGANISM="Genus nov. species nov., Strain RCC2339" /LENGTH=275 /DNA_ID=CAMNT_0007111917 /DNA_START=61 /DNA_END=885 /DNA_ORIENTATION=+
MGLVLSRLARLGLLDVSIQFLCFVVAAFLRTEIFYDISASLTYVFLTYYSLSSYAPRWPVGRITRTLVNSALVVTWAVRLGTFLLLRIIRDGGRDVRFDRVRNRPARFFIFWMVQAAWILITALPVYLINAKRVPEGQPGAELSEKLDSTFSGRDVIGWAIWVFGFLVETIADAQKSAFRSNPSNSNKWIDTGLWSVAEAPNYGGEICQWVGLFLSCSSAFTHPMEYMSIISPLFVYFLLSRVSGLPLLRKRNMKRWGNNPEYLAYLDRTYTFIP